MDRTEAMDKQDPAEEVMRRCLAMRSRAVARAISRPFDDALRPFGITIAQYTILVALRLRPAPSITALADVLEIERSGLSRNLRLLKATGLVAMGGDGASRAQTASLTTAGRALIDDALPAWRTAQDAARARLGDSGERDVHSAFTALKGQGWPDIP
ncbi:MAG: MarR family winged helix-turn-helix transcriptional regulator [Pseudomonadota bacterium]